MESVQDQIGERMMERVRAHVRRVDLQVALKAFVLAFLGANLWLRYSTLFHHSSFMSVLMGFLGVGSVVVILFPKLLKFYLFLFGASFFLFGFRAYDLPSQVFDTVVVFVVLTVCIINFRDEKEWGTLFQC